MTGTGDLQAAQETDPTPQERESVTMGWVHPSQAREEAWRIKQEAKG